jgi:uncharacterized membrane protein YeaQ/YmgE (transglycosylase-associated protein family)
MFHFIGFIITGLIVGLLARAFKPGDDSMSIGKTAVLGMVGALIAGWFGRMVGWYDAGEGAGYIASTFGAVLALAVYYSITRHNPRQIGHS